MLQQVTAEVVVPYMSTLGIDEPLAAGASDFYLAEALGSTVGLADSAGTLQTAYTYGPFGTTAVTEPSSANPFQYTGRENDGTGLYYYRARYYHPMLARFISEDPLGVDSGDLNLYAYANNNPINDVDPTGEVASILIFAGTSAAADLAYQTLVQGKSLSCVDWGSVLLAGIEGAVLPTFFKVGGMGVRRVRFLTKVPPKSPLPRGHSGATTYRDIKISGIVRAETHPVPRLGGPVPLPHAHLDFVGGRAAKTHVPFPSPFATGVGVGTGALSDRACDSDE